MLNLSRCLVLFFLVSLFVSFISCTVSFAMTKAEIQYTIEEKHINSRIDLSWAEKLKARTEAYDRIFGKSEPDGTCWLVCGGVILAIIIAGIAGSKKDSTPPLVHMRHNKDKRGDDIAFKSKVGDISKRDKEKDDADRLEAAINFGFSVDDETKECPSCTKTIKLSAKVCEHCNAKFSDDAVNESIQIAAAAFRFS